MSSIAWLNETEADPRELGGKGASLAALSRGGFRVPAGFCLRAAAYRRFVEANALQRPLDRLIAAVQDLPRAELIKGARAAVAEFAPHLETATLPADVRAEVQAAYRALSARTGAGLVVAVRSSALSEDAAGASSAGLYETYLNVRDTAAVLDAVLGCYRSLWTARAVQYRAFKRIDSASEAMAVVVMQMVAADVSGVAFTAHPVTGDAGQLLINASWGLGEAIVSGRVTPDEFLLDKATSALLSRTIHAKEREIRADPSGASGTVAVDVPAARAVQAALTAAEVRELTDVCLRVERQYGRPMDIEWAIAAGRLYLLQARPITALG